MKSNHIIYIVLVIFFASCNSNHIPKPRGYFRIDTPAKEYRELGKRYPFNFEYPVYAEISKYQGSPEEKESVDNWLNIDFPAYKAHLYLTFKSVEDNLRELIEDSHSFVYKHVGMADAINQTEFMNSDNDVFGVLFDIKGNTASSVQFFLTDSVSSFIRGALYFDCEPNMDSLAPLISFFRKDVEYLMETFTWQ